MRIPSYPKVYNLGHKAIVDLLKDPVVVEEKLDGSQLSWGLLDGELHIRSKGAQIYIEQPPKMFAKAVEVIKQLNLHPEWIYRGECLTKPKHNTLAYDRCPKGFVAIFDIQDGLESYLSWDQKCIEAYRLGLECVPWLSYGRLTLNDFKKMLDEPSFLGGQLVEGVAIKNYARFTRDGKAMMGKHVSEKFKEVHQGDWKKRNPSHGDIILKLSVHLRTPARWEKAVQHLREAGTLTDTPKDIGPLIAEVKRDTLEEEGDNAMRELWDWAKAKVLKGVAAGLPEWYKNKLMEAQFDGPKS